MTDEMGDDMISLAPYYGGHTAVAQTLPPSHFHLLSPPKLWLDGRFYGTSLEIAHLQVIKEMACRWPERAGGVFF